MSLEWIGAKKRWREQPRGAGANAGWRLADRCFVRGEKYGAFFEGEKSPAGGGKCGLPHLVAKLLGESVTGRNIIGKMCGGATRGKPCHAGANARGAFGGKRFKDRR